MRITSSMIFNQLASSLQSNLEDFAKLNNQLSTGKKINKSSDDVIGTIKAMSYQVTIGANTQFKRNIDQANISLDFIDKTMGSVSDTLSKLRKMTSTANNPVDNRELYAQQAAGLRDYLLDLSNSNLDNGYVFSGYKTDQKAFAYNFSTNKYDYQGDSGEIKVLFDKGASTPVNIPGSYKRHRRDR
jgi:flagellar hook-associated protein 3 FlgL